MGGRAMSKDIVVLSCGLFTPVGLSARETAASARSRTARLTSIEWRDNRFERFTVGVMPEGSVPALHEGLKSQPLTFRENRMLRLAGKALHEASLPFPPGATPIPVMLGLPELHTQSPIQGPDFLKRLACQSGVNLDLAQSQTIPKGRASAGLALKQACELLDQGGATHVFVGGVDCQVDLFVLGTLDQQRRIRNSRNPDGFAPGEGAGFLLLTTADRAKTASVEPLARIVGTASATEEGHLHSAQPYKGEGLATAFESLFGATPPTPKVNCIYASFNGEHYWAKEFGVAMLRHREHFDDAYAMEHPAECFGDLGAAHGAVMLGLAALRLKRTCSENPSLLSMSSDLGDRSVALLSKV